MVLDPPLQRNASLSDGRNHEIAPVSRRLAAGIVDWVVAIGWGVSAAVVVAIVTGLVFLGDYSFQVNFGAGLLYFGLPVTYGVLILRHVFNAFRVSSKGDTLGHRLCGLRIMRIGGQEISLGRSLVRQYLGSPFLFAYGVPMILLIPIGVFINPFSGVNRSSNVLTYLWDTVATNWIIWGLGVAVVLAIVNHVWMMFDAKGRGWHDWLVGTVVVMDYNVR